MKIAYWMALCLVLSTCYSLNAQVQLDCNETRTIIDFEPSTYIIPSTESISLFLRGGDGGGVDFRGPCNTLIKGGVGAIAELTLPVSDTGSALRPGGTLAVYVGERGGNRSPACQNLGPVSGAGGGSSAVLYLPPGRDPGERNWLILAVAGGGSGATRPAPGITDKVGKGGQAVISGGNAGDKLGGRFSLLCAESPDAGLNIAGRGGGVFCGSQNERLGDGSRMNWPLPAPPTVEDPNASYFVRLLPDSNIIESRGATFFSPTGGTGFTGGGSAGEGGGGGGGFHGGAAKPTFAGGGGGSYVLRNSLGVYNNSTTGGANGGADSRSGLVQIITSGTTAGMARCQPDFAISTDDNGTEQIQLEDIDNGSILPACGGSIALMNEGTAISAPFQVDCTTSSSLSIHLVVSDLEGNVVNDCRTNIIILDNIRPRLVNCLENTAREITLPALSYTVLGSELDPTVEDNCGVVNLTNNINGASTLAGATLSPGRNEITWTASDNSGNTTSCTTKVSIDYPNSDYFITTWQTTSPYETITIPTVPGIAYDYMVDWGDGTITTNHTGNATHTYSNTGVHTVRIVGNFPRIFFNKTGDRFKIRTIEQWGNIKWTSMANAFKGCANLNITNPNIDIPDLDNVTDMSSMFESAFAFNGQIGDWNVGNVENMSNLFAEAIAFNQPISNWDVENVEYMYRMFYDANAFNQPIGNWNVGNVTDMSEMFLLATNFNQPIGSWDVEKVENIYRMFAEASAFNQPIGNWNVSNVTDMANMFFEASAFNQPIGNWNVSNVTYMFGMFEKASAFNQDIGNWDVGQVEDMRLMFINALAFDQDISSWNVGQVQRMDRMFEGASLSTPNYDALLLGWSTQNLQPNVTFDAGGSTYCAGASGRAALMSAPNNWTIIDAGVAPTCAPEAICQDITVQLDAAGEVVINAVDVNNNSSSLVGPLTFTLSPTTFNCADLGDQPVVLMVTDGNNSSSSCNATVTVVDDILPNMVNCLENVTREITITASSYTVLGSELDPIAEDNCGTYNLTNNINGTSTLAGLELMPGINEIIWTAIDHSGNTTHCTTNVIIEYPASDYFITTWRTTAPNESITIPTTGAGYDYIVDWGDGTITTNQTGNATHSYANAGLHTVRIIGDFPRIFFNFSGDRNKIVTVEQWGSITWTSMASAFAGCTNLAITNIAIDVPNLTQVRDMSGMFWGASSLTGGLDAWDVSQVEDMSNMFRQASNFAGGIANWDVSQVLNMSGMFQKTNSLAEAIGTWNVGNVEDMSRMFFAAIFNEPIGAWDVGKVKDMSNMFAFVLNFNQPIGNWDVGAVEDMNGMFYEASAFDQDISSWNIAQVADMSRMFTETSLSTVNYDALLMGWSTQNLQSNVTFDAGGSTYCAGASGRAALISAPNNWTITDAGVAPTCLPEAVCQDITVQLDATGEVTVNAEDLNNNSFAPAGPLTFEVNPATFNCSFLGDNPVVFTVTDINNNSSTCNATVTVLAGNDQRLSPVLEGITFNPITGLFEACFGYDNDNPCPVTVPVGFTNTFTPGNDLGQPSEFLPGRQVSAFCVDLAPGATMVWTLIGPDGSTRTATASAPQTTILAYVWDDQNGNGKQDGSEPGIEGAILELVRHSDGMVLQTATSQVDGTTTFAGLSDYDGTQVKLKFYEKADHRFTLKDQGNNDNIDSDVNRSNGFTSVFTLDTDAQTIQWDAGLWSPGSVEAYVWDDQNGNGKQDNSEPAISGVEVTLLESDGLTELGLASTDANGVATFADVPADRPVLLQFSELADHRFTLKNQGNNDNIDSDTNRSNGKTGTFQADKGAQTHTKLDAGLWSPGSVEAYVWDDQNGNGKQDNGEPAIANVQVDLLESDDTFVITVFTNAEGIAEFSNVPADRPMKLQFHELPNYRFALKDQGNNDNINSDANRTNGKTGTFQADRGAQMHTKLDAGLWSPGSVEAYVWDDQNGNGKQDNNEPAITGVQVKLLEANGSTELGSTTTNAAGLAIFTDIPADRPMLLQFFELDDYRFSLKDQGNNDNINSDANRTNGKTGTFQANRGMQTHTKLDAGLWSPGSVEAYVWDDQNGNGKQDNGEPAIAGVEVKLLESDGSTELGNSTTDGTGLAVFNSVPANRPVMLQFSEATDHRFTLKDRGNNDKIDSDANRTNGKTGTIQASKGAQVHTQMDAGLWSSGIVEALVWDDLNGNGKQDDDEPGLEGVHVHLLETDGEILKSTTSGANGLAILTNVPANRSVKLQFGDLVGYERTLKDQGNNDNIDSDSKRSNGTTATFTADRGKQTFASWDAGYIAMGSGLVESTRSGNQTTREKDVAVEPAFVAPEVNFDQPDSKFRDFSLYPNPTRDFVNLNLENYLGERVMITVYSQSGQVVQQREIEEVNQSNISLDINNLPSGTYLIELRTAQYRQTKILIISGQ